MKRNRNPLFFMVTNILLVLNLLTFWSIRSMWSGIISLTAKPIPYVLCIVLAITALLTTCFTMYKKRPFGLAIFGTILNVLFLGLNGYMISVTLDSLYYFVKSFLSGCIFIGVLAFLLFLIFCSHKISLFEQKWMPPVVLILLFVVGFFSVYEIQLTNDIIKTPVVYEVEDTYQITFTTKAKGEAWVVIDGVEYNDTLAGGRKTESKIHKITVPMSVLDEASSYTVYTRAMLLRGPYEALQGPTISETYFWKGVNTADGLHYYVFSDNHLAQKSTAAAANYWGDRLDFLIALGDSVNWMESEKELSKLLYLVSDITKGQIPVIHARGNHEAYGLAFDQYSDYVGAKDDTFYYTFRMQNIWGIVLDMGVDHEDDFVEYAGTAKYNLYRKEQTRFLDEVIKNAENEYLAEGVTYRIGICHVPITFYKVGSSNTSYRKEWTTRLNEIQLSVMYSGHLHDLMFVDASLEPGITLTLLPEFSGKTEKNDQYTMSGANFPTILVSKRGMAQARTDKENVFDKYFIGVAASVENDETILQYTNESGQMIETISPWFEGVSYGKEIHIKNK